MKYKEIFKKSLAEQLEERGHKPSRVRKNLKMPKYDVYVFKNSIELRKDMEEITQIV